jgi:hypothetical protein
MGSSDINYSRVGVLFSGTRHNHSRSQTSGVTMKEMLSYATPGVGQDDPRRKSAAAHARGNGRGCVVLGLFFMLLTFMQVAGSKSWFTIILFGSYAALFFTSGVLQTLCGNMLRRPNSRWVAILRYTVIANLIGVLPLLAIICRAMVPGSSIFVIQVIVLGALALVEISLGVGLWKVLALRKAT